MLRRGVRHSTDNLVAAARRFLVAVLLVGPLHVGMIA